MELNIDVCVLNHWRLRLYPLQRASIIVIETMEDLLHSGDETAGHSSLKSRGNMEKESLLIGKRGFHITAEHNLSLVFFLPSSVPIGAILRGSVMQLVSRLIMIANKTKLLGASLS